MRGVLMAMVTAVFVAAGIKDVMAEEWELAVLKLIVVVEMWTIEYLKISLDLEKKLGDESRKFALKSLEDLAEEFNKKHREQLERQKDNEQD